MTVSMTHSRTRSQYYMPQLDALRAFAVLAVMVNHFLPVHRYLPFTLDYVSPGMLAVRLFFVLSGFLITGILLRSRGRQNALQRFYIRRVLRIFPIYYLTLFVAFAAGLVSFWEHGFWFLTYLSNFIQASTNPGVAVGHLWSLAVEEQFYLVWPTLILFLPYRYLLRVIVGSIVLALVFRFVMLRVGTPIMAAIFTPGCLDSLGLGALLAYVCHDAELQAYRARFLKVCLRAGLGLFTVLTALYLYRTAFSIIYTFLIFSASLLFTVLIARAAVGFEGRAKSVLEWGPLVYIGKISYGLYVYHNFMPTVILYLNKKLGLGVSGTFETAGVATVLTFLVAIASWHLIEKPISKLKDLAGEPAAGEAQEPGVTLKPEDKMREFAVPSLAVEANPLADVMDNSAYVPVEDGTIVLNKPAVEPGV